jgi:hypothetical protein
MLDVFFYDLSIGHRFSVPPTQRLHPLCRHQIILADRFLRRAGTLARFRRAGTVPVGLFEA